MWHRTQIGDLAIRRSISNQRLCAWRSKFFLKCISVFIQTVFLQLHNTYRTIIWYSRCTFSCDRSVMQDTLHEEKAPSWRCLGFRWRDFPNNSHMSLYVNLLKTACGCLSVIIRSFTWTAVKLDGFILAVFVELFLNIHPPLHVIRYKHCNYGCNQPHIKCNLPEQ